MPTENQIVISLEQNVAFTNQAANLSLSVDHGWSIFSKGTLSASHGPFRGQTELSQLRAEHYC